MLEDKTITLEDLKKMEIYQEYRKYSKRIWLF